MSYFHGTEIEIWAGFVPVVGTEKKNWDDYEQLLRVFFSCFWRHFFFKHNSVRTKKLHNKLSLLFFKPFFVFFLIKLFFLGLRTFSNENVLHKRLLLQEWVFRLG